MEETLFTKIVSLGYNCEISFRIEDYTGKDIDSYPLSWAYVSHNIHLGDALKNRHDWFNSELELLPSGMFVSKKYQISFHGKTPLSELRAADGSKNEEAIGSTVEELKKRMKHLMDKFDDLLQSEEKTLFVMKVPEGKTLEEKTEYVKEVNDFLQNNYNKKNYCLLIVLEEVDREVCGMISKIPNVAGRTVKVYAEDNDTINSGDIYGWLSVFYEFVPEMRAKRDDFVPRKEYQELKAWCDELQEAKDWLLEKYETEKNENAGLKKENYYLKQNQKKRHFIFNKE